MAPYYPPAFTPPTTQLPFFSAVQRMLDNPMEGWPQGVYEELIFAPPRRDFRTLYVCDPVALRTVMLDDVDNFPKSAMQSRLLRPLLGDGLMTAERERRRWQRQAAAPSFQPARVRAADDSMADAADAALARWDLDRGPKAIEATEEMIRITFEIILDAMLSGREGVDIAVMSRHMGAYLMSVGRPNVLDLLGAPDWARDLYAPESAAAVRYLKAAVEDMLRVRMANPGRGDLIQKLIESKDPHTGRAMSPAELRDNLLTFWAAGHETTAIVLTWALYLIASHAGTDARLVEEIAREAGDAPITADVADRLTFTRQVVLEAMRLFPPVPVMTRTSLRATTLGGHEVRRGDVVVIPVYALHRHRVHWEDPNAFDPDRFAPAKALEKRRFVYMPFGAGKRTCIGMGVAIQEAVIVLATLIRSARPSINPGLSVRPLFRITMRPEGGLPVTMTARSRAIIARRADSREMASREMASRELASREMAGRELADRALDSVE